MRVRTLQLFIKKRLLRLLKCHKFSKLKQNNNYFSARITRAVQLFAENDCCALVGYE